MRHTLASRSTVVLTVVSMAILLTLVACGGRPNITPVIPGNMSILISDGPTGDWATVGIKIQSIALTPQGGGPPVTVYTAPTPVPTFNLVQLNQLGALLANAQVQPGTYTDATLTLAANPGDVTLTVSAAPEPGFAGTAGATIPSNQIEIIGAQGNAGSMMLPLDVKFDSPLVVKGNQSNVLNIEFDLTHPAFLVANVPPSGPTIWSVNFLPICRDRKVDDITHLLLQHIYGTVNTVAADNSSIVITRDFPVEPATTPETAITTSQKMSFLADATNGTTFYDLDAKTTSTIKNFSAQASSLPNKFVRIAARYQTDGSLVAVRIWASSSFAKVWLDPEGYVLHVNTGTSVLTVSNEDGTPVDITVNSATQFFFRQPSDGAADATAIGTGPSFLTNIVRGFEVHVSVADPLANPLVAQSVDIEDAEFSGNISAPTTTGFTISHTFETTSDNYNVQLKYVAANTPNGDANGTPITGYKWWNFAFPKQVDSGANAIPDFIAAANSTVNFGGTVGTVTASGSSYGVWGNSANPNGWSSLFTVLDPLPIPLAKVSANWVTTTNGGNFGITVPNGGTTPVVVNLSSVAGSATEVYQVDRQSNIVTVSPQDITTSAGLNNIAAHLINGTAVKVYGVPQSDGSIKAFVVIYFTGTTPMS